MVDSCRICAKHGIIKPEPLCPSPFPERPWQVSGTDLFYSQSMSWLSSSRRLFFSIRRSCCIKENKTATKVIRALKAIFARQSIPEKVWSDNGPSFDSADYTHFAREWGFEVSPSTPRYLQSNGEAVRAVQTVKNILKREKDEELATVACRSTPLSTGYSPVEILMGRKLQNTIPTFQT